MTMMTIYSHIFRFVRSIPLASILEPIADLRRGQSGRGGQFPLLPRRGVRIARVPVSQRSPRAFLETITRLFTVPDRPWQRELPPYPVLPDGAQSPPSDLLRLDVVRLQPKRLQFGVVVRRERVTFDELVELLEVAPVESDHGLRLDHALVPVQVFAGGQRPQEASQSVDVAAVLQDFTDAGDLLLGETERGQGGG